MARKSNINTTFLLLILVIVVASCVRFFDLGRVPASLYWEEVALGYDAYSILKTGKDFHGQSFPLVAFTSFGDYKPSLYFYAVTASMAFLGATDFAIRFPSALFGVITVIALFFIGRQIKLSDHESLIGSFVLAIMPMAIQFSRGAFEVNLGTGLLTLAVLTLLSARNKAGWLVISAILFSGSMYAYHGFRVFAPLLALGLYILYWKKYPIKWVMISIITALLLITPIIKNINNPIVNQRFAQTSFFPDSQAVHVTNQFREQYGNTLLSKVVFHRYWWWTAEMLGNYFANFSLGFLFLEGDGNSRHQTGEFGPLYHWQLIALIACTYWLVSKKEPRLWPLIIWVVLTPIPVMLTKTNPHTLRMSVIAPAMALLSAYGIYQTYLHTQHKKLFSAIVLGVIGIELTVFGHFYAKHYPNISAPEWQYGYKSVVEYTESIKHAYRKIYFTREFGRPSMYVLWYGRYNPIEIQALDNLASKDQGELLVVGNYIFTDNPAGEVGSLVVDTAKNPVPDSAQVLKEVNFPNGQKAFRIYEIL